MMLPVAVLFPVLAGSLLPLFRFQSGKKRAVYVETVTILTSLLTLAAVWFRDGRPLKLFDAVEGLPVALFCDGASCIFAVLVALMWPFAALYAFSYMEHEERPNRFFAWYTVTYGVTLGLAFSANLLTLYIFYECLTMATLPLVNHKDDLPSRRAGVKYAAWTITGAAVGFVALIFTIRYGDPSVFRIGGSLTGAAGHEQLLRWIYLLAFVGFGTKAAVAPTSGWLPTASVAPTPVTALLHAVAVVNAGAFAVLRVTRDVFGTGLLYGTFAQTTVLAIACFTILLGAVMAVREQHLKRRLAWSTVSNLSYMLMGAALMTDEGFTGAFAHLVFHGVMKIALFFCAGAILVKTGKEYVQDLRGLHRQMPLTCAAFTAASAAMLGVPPLCGFVSKWRLLTAAAATGLPMGYAAIVTLLLAAVLTAVYLFGPVTAMYFRPLNAGGGEETPVRNDPDDRMMFPILAFCTAMLLLGLCAEPVMAFLNGAACGLL